MPRKLSASASKRAVDKQLARYRAMRDFHLTSEPAGGTVKAGAKAEKNGASLPFVIQKHAATRLHYDFRLGWNGVLKSWAVAKGPSYFPGDKRLAVQVEDHPIEYGGFEGTIPKGQYGGGTVMVWDQGTWEPLGDVDRSLKAGNLKFVLHGKKLRGKWVLVRMGGKAAHADKPNWLLIKEHDEFEQSADSLAITEEAPDSVVTGRDLDAIALSKDHVWNSNGGGLDRTGSKGREAAGGESHRDSRKKLRDLLSGVSGAAREPLPSFISPQLATQAKAPPLSAGWFHELKLDGYRIEACIHRRNKDAVQLLTRTGLDWTHRMKPVARAVAALPVETALLDGEVVVLGANGATSFADLQIAFQEGANYPLTYFLFDLLHLNGRSLRNLPLEKRKEILALLLADSSSDGTVRLSEHLEGNANQIFHKACALGAEGIVSKLASSKYSSGHSGSWVKLKCYRQQEMVIGGFRDLSNGMRGIGALLLGYYHNRKLVYAGRTGTGFTQKTHRILRDMLEPLERKEAPFHEIPRSERRGARWVKPELVAQVAFSNWTRDNLMRQASFKGLREDKPASEVHREEPEDPATANASGGKTGAGPGMSKSSRVKPGLVGSVRAGNSPQRELPVRLTHPGRVLDDVSGVTKQTLAEYYLHVSSHILPHISDRPLSLVRCPEGTGKPCFFQKHKSSTLPEEIGSIDIVDHKTGKTEPYITLSTVKGFVGLAQMSVLEIHPWGSRNESLERPDRIVFDLDPDTSIAWADLASTALELRARLKHAGLKSYLKSTGGKGLHVVAPIRAERSWPEVKQFAHRLVLGMEKANPALYITRMTKAARSGKIYLDYLRNDRGSTSVAPFSPRARSGMSVSMPLAWSELESGEHPYFSVSNFSDWKHRLARDPWKGWDTSQSFPAAVAG
jgi:bifunctional non-homologous end joining protein LigD